jgi:hypothetical protein
VAQVISKSVIGYYKGWRPEVGSKLLITESLITDYFPSHGFDLQTREPSGRPYEY